MSLRCVATVVLCALLASCETDVPDGSGSAVPQVAGDLDSAGGGVPALDSAPPPANDREPNTLLLTVDGWGPLRIGMTRAEVVAAAGEDANPAAVGGPDPAQCDEFRPADAPEGVLVMIERGVLTRISVSRSRDISTPEGFRVGSQGADVVAGYGARARVDPHPFLEPPARYITVWQQSPPGAARRGIRYEVDADGVVAHLRAGGASIESVEGCV